MKPSGSASRKNARSAAPRAGPVQPKMTARGIDISGPNQDAGDVAVAQLGAELLRLRRIRDGSRLHAIEGAAGAEIGARPPRLERAEEIPMRRPQRLPFVPRRLLAAQRCELQAIAARGRCALRLAGFGGPGCGG